MNNSEYAIPSKSRNVSNDESLTDQDHDDDPRRQASYVSKKFGRGFTERGYPRHLQWVCTWEKKI